jgi:hypothetical protein
MPTTLVTVLHVNVTQAIAVQLPIGVKHGLLTVGIVDVSLNDGPGPVEEGRNVEVGVVECVGPLVACS